MNNIKKPLLKSPLLGAVFLTLLFSIYILVFFTSFNSLANDIIALFKLLPLIFIVLTVISYIISVPLNFILYQKMESDLKETNFFINMALLIGFLLSLCIAMIDYSFHESIAKSVFIVIGISLMTTMNANYFLILANIITIKDNKNDTKKAN